MDFDNGTSFPALAYAMVDPHGEKSHVVVARGTYDLGPASRGGEPVPELTHEAAPAAEPDDLSFRDVYFGEMNRSSIRSESDLAQRKPRCDVIVVGAAHSPTGETVPRVDVRVRIQRLTPIAGTLVDCSLAVHGARAFERRGERWALGEPEPFLELPLRYEHAFGGELKVYAGTEADRRLDEAHRLGEAARRGHPEGGAAPVAHATCMQNPVGVGFLEGWYADAAEVDRWPAPRIEAPGAGITAAIFERMVQGKVGAGEVPELSPRGVGVIAKPWQPRLKLAGTLDAAWLAGRWPLMPDDFDMAYWNGAHRDMQCEHLVGGEVVELWNLLPPGAPGVLREGAGTVCRFRVPAPTVAGRFTSEGGAVAFARLPIDTLIVDCAAMRLSVAWRAVVLVSQGIAGAVLLALADMKRDAA
jgi:hypothetical protein